MYRKLIEQLGKQEAEMRFFRFQDSILYRSQTGEVAGLTWQDINLEEQYLTIRRSVRYNGATHKHEIGQQKWKKVRVVDFGDTLADILRKAKKEQHKNRFQYGDFISGIFTEKVMEKNRVHYEYYHLGMTRKCARGLHRNLLCMLKGGWLSGTSGNHRNSLPDSRKKSTGA